MQKEKIITINKEKCSGCGKCKNYCPAGVIKLVDGKAELIKECICKMAGNCIEKCPTGALSIEVIGEEGINQQDTKKENVVYLNFSENKNDLSRGCSGGRLRAGEAFNSECQPSNFDFPPQLEQWPIKIELLPPKGPYFERADLLVTADCVPVVYENYQQEFLDGRIIATGCPKLGDQTAYMSKLASIIWHNNLNSIGVVKMELPCCHELFELTRQAVEEADSILNVKEITIGVDGQEIEE